MGKCLVSLALFASLSSCVSATTPDARDPERDYQRDLAAVAGERLSSPELEIAEYVLVYYCVKSGEAPLDSSLDAALDALDEGTYAKAIASAVSIAKNPAAHGLLRLGRAGERILKALIVGTGDAISAAGRTVEKMAAEYDRRHNH